MAKQLVTQGKKLGFRVRAIDLANHKPEELASGAWGAWRATHDAWHACPSCMAPRAVTTSCY